MLRGLYAAASGMIAQMARQDVYAGNLANANSVGHRRGQVVMGSFEADLAAQTATGGTRALPASLDLSQGPVTTTSRNLDLALDGPGFFTIQTPTGLAYTRDGRFQLDGDKRLVTAAGYPVLGESGLITVNSPDFTITESGEVHCQGQTLGKLRITNLTNPTPTGNSLYTGTPSPSTQYAVKQGALEQSNVNAIQEMGRMMNGYRLYEANATALRYQDETLSSLMRLGQ